MGTTASVSDVSNGIARISVAADSQSAVAAYISRLIRDGAAQTAADQLLLGRLAAGQLTSAFPRLAQALARLRQPGGPSALVIHGLPVDDTRDATPIGDADKRASIQAESQLALGDMNRSNLKPIELAPLDDDALQGIVQKIVQAFHPLRIILFGSRARGDHRADSDVDLFVEMETQDPPAERRVKVRRLFRPSPCGLDILVYTPEEVVARRHSLASLVPLIEKEGKVLYEQPG